MTKCKKNINCSIDLSKDEVKTLLESLLFSSSVDVCASWYQEDTKKMLDIAEKLRTFYPNVLTENVYISRFKDDDEMFMDKHTDQIIENFPEIEHLEKEQL